MTRLGMNDHFFKPVRSTRESIVHRIHACFVRDKKRWFINILFFQFSNYTLSFSESAFDCKNHFQNRWTSQENVYSITTYCLSEHYEVILLARRYFLRICLIALVSYYCKNLYTQTPNLMFFICIFGIFSSARSISLLCYWSNATLF